MKIQTYQEPESWKQNQELVKDRVVEREEAHINGLLHLSTHLLIVNENGELFCRKRSEDELRYKGQWTTTIGLHVELERGDLRILQGHLSQEIQLQYVGEFKLHDGFENEVCGLYVTNLKEDDLPEDFKLNRSFLTPENLKDLIKQSKTTPHLKEAYSLLNGEKK